MNLATLLDLLNLINDLSADDATKVAVSFEILGFGEQKINGVDIKFDDDMPVKIILKG